ncbi:MAG: tRNA guanosine(34) transglycosylase Tgt [Xanthomonadaceae bacterium]|nr:tRNA guanosine(34) transglycosylase Tgt [Rhodospirillaceae bacterium]NIA17607.1 tRNA guanosine(34) transglycosylase Tgt [Xanthomonadaceae bacterium]
MFRILKKSKYSEARKGKIITKRGVINTPFFMPDATRGYIKSLNNNELHKINIGPMVVNTYHLFLQPGTRVIKKIGGIHKFINWNSPLLSDSGGYQIFSLIHKNTNMGKIIDDKAIFRSPIDGSIHSLTPEKSIQIQFDLSVDMMVCLDDPVPNDYDKDKTKKAVERTIVWAKRSKREYERQIKKRKIKIKERPLIFGVIQGGNYFDLREFCVKELIKIGFDGYGFGARHIDKNGKFLEKILQFTANLIPQDSLRFALGVGTPEDIVRCVKMGWDMFDCVIPTREARHGKLFLWKKDDLNKKNFYKTINIIKTKFKNNFKAIDDKNSCNKTSYAYLNHIFKTKDGLGKQIAIIHNLKFYMELMKKIRKNI